MDISLLRYFISHYIRQLFLVACTFSRKIKRHCSFSVLTRWFRNPSIVSSPSGDTNIAWLRSIESLFFGHFFHSGCFMHRMQPQCASRSEVEASLPGAGSRLPRKGRTPSKTHHTPSSEHQSHHFRHRPIVVNLWTKENRSSHNMLSPF